MAGPGGVRERLAPCAARGLATARASGAGNAPPRIPRRGSAGRIRSSHPTPAPPHFLRGGDLDYRMVWTFHHIVIDGRSQLIVLKEVFDLYEALRAGNGGELSPPGLFRDHVTTLASRDRSGDEEFWRARVGDCSESTSLNLPPTSPRAAATRRTGECHKEVPDEITSRLRRLARQHQLTLST